MIMGTVPFDMNPDSFLSYFLGSHHTLGTDTAIYSGIQLNVINT